ncbi:MAG: substrate-binding domain-containing protein [Thaumarchaeota archaeon]|nr:substrate-binding domain-containing protein [Nitrososphaerota archaeon]
MRKIYAILLIATIAIAGLISIQLHLGQKARIRITTTTSLYATVASEFSKREASVSFDFIPVGSGEALRRAELGDACMVFVHAPSLEKKYLEKGVITDRRIFAYNYFIIVGPASDPAGVSDAESPLEAFSKIYQAGEAGKACFVSRGDNSGTHVKELSIWRAAGLNPSGKPWYMETGSGMSATLLVANERNAYALSDIGTYLKLRSEGRLPNLRILYQGGVDLINIYSVYLVSTCEDPERDLAIEFMDFVVGDGQDLIASYGVDRYGRPLFNPAKDNLSWLEETWSRLAAS